MVRLPKLGNVRVRESTRRLRSLALSAHSPRLHTPRLHSADPPEARAVHALGASEADAALRANRAGTRLLLGGVNQARYTRSSAPRVVLPRRSVASMK